MAINRLQYPIDYDEAISTLRSMSDSILAENRTNFVCGDTRPEILNWTIRRLEAEKAFWESVKPLL